MSTYSRVNASFLCLLMIGSTIVKAGPVAVGCGSVQSEISYQVSVGQLMAALYENTPASGFSLVGELGDIFAYALCRGDLSLTDCLNCLIVGITDIHANCPTTQEAIIYYDYCYLRIQSYRYTYDSNIYYCLAGQIQIDPHGLDPILSDMFITLNQLAPQQQRYFACGYIHLNDEALMYGYVQCFNDMSADDCANCLESLLQQLPTSCTSGRLGGTLVGGSCLLRYESYEFFNH